ncbi:EF-hand domain-containing protein [Henriciella marina]|uniref:EF-hand domain-containing protein n=1 Tax=Henriciella marina TaxID=453851 RepID=UPI00037DA7AF|nr:hypothetical protein [Henriciella marina]
MKFRILGATCALALMGAAACEQEPETVNTPAANEDMATDGMADNDMAENGAMTGDVSEDGMSDDMMGEPADSMTTENDMMTDESVQRENAQQAFTAIDQDGDSMIGREEWSEWQNRGNDTAIRFDDHDLDSDGNFSFEEYYDAVTGTGAAN